MADPVVGVDVRALAGAISGIGFYTRSLLTALASRGAATYVALAHTEIPDRGDLERYGIRFEHQQTPLGVLWQQLVLPRRLARGDIDLFWSPLLTLPVASATPGVVTIHDLTPLLYPETHSLKVKLSTRPFLRRTVAVARAIVADSRATAADIRQHYPAGASKTTVVYPGVDPEFSPATDAQRAETRRQLGHDNGYILFAGTLEPRKNVGFLIDAWEALKHRDPSAPGLVIAGGYGWRSSRLLERIRRLERTRDLTYLGHVDRTQLVRTFQAATAFVLPSLYEGFGLPAAEAMACGVPTIVTRTSSLPEVVGDAGLQVEIGDTESLARALRSLTSDRVRADETGQRCLEQAARFTWDRAATEMKQVFDEALR